MVVVVVVVVVFWCDLMFGQVLSGGLHQGVAQLQQEGFFPDFEAQIRPWLSFR